MARKSSHQMMFFLALPKAEMIKFELLQRENTENIYPGTTGYDCSGACHYCHISP